MGNSKKSKKNIRCGIVLDYETDNGNRGLGDVIISTPIIQALSKKYASRIDIVLRQKVQPLLFSNPYVGSVYETAAGLNPDLHLIMGWKLENYYVKRNQQPRIDAMAELFGVSLDDKQPRLYYSEGEKIPNSIGIAIESVSPSRTWRNDYLIELMARLPQFDWHVFGQKEIELPAIVHNYLGKLDLMELIQEVQKMERFITMDSLFSHLTAAFSIPTIVMYTTVPREWRCTYYQKTVGLQAPVNCSPCWDYQRKDISSLISECHQRQNSEHSIKCIDSFIPDLIEKVVRENLL